MIIGVQPRGIDRENHDRPYKNMLKTINDLQWDCDNIDVYARGKLEEEPIKMCSSKDEINICQAICNIRGIEHQNILKHWKTYIERIESVKSRIQLYGQNEKLVENSMRGLEQIKSELQKEILDKNALVL